MLQRGALAGLALLLTAAVCADEALRKQIHREYRHQSYMLVEDDRGARLYLFDSGRARVMRLTDSLAPGVSAALSKTRSTDPRERTRGLAELAGSAAPEALDVALQLLNDPVAAVRDEARNLVLDHPDGGPLVAALGLVDDDLEEQED